ncbi:transposase [Treponema pedis]|uniref:transposase n=1 Tax=Treponema pedis TaxID=409322 RepID=UPI0009B7205A
MKNKLGNIQTNIKKTLNKDSKGLVGRPPAYDYIMMFKIIILQRLYNISDNKVQYQINNQVFFMRFLRL